MGIRIILASASEGRKGLMERLGLPFEVIAAGVLEDAGGTDPSALVMVNAERKALGAAALCKGEDYIIIAADTVVYAAGAIIGKPGNAADAAAMLGSLSGQSHEVRTGVCLLRGGERALFCDTARVFMRELDPCEIERYVKTGEPMGKAGSYAAQGRSSVFIERIEGDPHTVVGLPVAKLCTEMKKLGVDVSSYW